MLLTLDLPRIHEQMTTARIERIHAVAGTRLAPGAALFDLRIDLSAVAAHDCPPVSYYRIVLREHAWLRDVAAMPGDDVEVGALLARFSAEAEEPLEGQTAIPVRITIAGMLGAENEWQ